MSLRTISIFVAVTVVLCGSVGAFVFEAVGTRLALQAVGAVEPIPHQATAADSRRASYLQHLFEVAMRREEPRLTVADGALCHITRVWTAWPSYRILHAAMAELRVRQSVGLEQSGSAGENFRSSWIVEGENGSYYLLVASSESFTFREYDEGARTLAAAKAAAERIVDASNGSGPDNQIDGTCSAMTLFRGGESLTRLSYGYDDAVREHWRDLRRILSGDEMVPGDGK